MVRKRAGPAEGRVLQEHDCGFRDRLPLPGPVEKTDAHPVKRAFPSVPKPDHAHRHDDDGRDRRSGQADREARGPAGLRPHRPARPSRTRPGLAHLPGRRPDDLRDHHPLLAGRRLRDARGAQLRTHDHPLVVRVGTSRGGLAPRYAGHPVDRARRPAADGHPHFGSTPGRVPHGAAHRGDDEHHFGVHSVGRAGAGRAGRRLRDQRVRCRGPRRTDDGGKARVRRGGDGGRDPPRHGLHRALRRKGARDAGSEARGCQAHGRRASDPARPARTSRRRAHGRARDGQPRARGLQLYRFPRPTLAASHHRRLQPGDPRGIGRASGRLGALEPAQDPRGQPPHGRPHRRHAAARARGTKRAAL
jgi:hypothetical protein